MRELARWWFRQLVALVPRSLRRAFAAAPDAVLVRPDPGAPADAGAATVAVRRRGGGGGGGGRRGETALGRLGDGDALARAKAARLPVLVDATAAALRKTLLLPAAVRGDVARLLSFEIDRETPFEAADVRWAHRVLPAAAASSPAGPGGVGDRVAIELAVVPRAAVDPLVESLRALGLPPRGLEVGPPASAPAGPGGSGSGSGSEDGDDVAALAPRFVPLAPGDPDPSAGRGRPLAVLAAAAAALALAALLLPLLERRLELARLDAAIEALRRDASLAAALRARIDDPSGDARLLAAGGHLPRSTLELLAATTEALPDAAFLEALELTGGAIELRGLIAGSAAGLVTRLAEFQAFSNPSLTAPVVVEGPRERFAIALELPDVAAVGIAPPAAADAAPGAAAPGAAAGDAADAAAVAAAGAGAGAGAPAGAPAAGEGE